MCMQGGHLQQLPVEPAVGRLLVMGAVFGCLEPVLTIAATLTHRSPFVMPMERRAEADAARRRLAGRAVSDHWALLNAADHFQQLRAERRHGELRDWCSRSFVMYNTMELICNLRLQLAQARLPRLLPPPATAAHAVHAQAGLRPRRDAAAVSRCSDAAAGLPCFTTAGPGVRVEGRVTLYSYFDHSHTNHATFRPELLLGLLQKFLLGRGLHPLGRGYGIPPRAVQS